MSRYSGIVHTGIRAAILIAGFGAAVACTPINRFHGFAPTPAELSGVQVGSTTRDEVVTRFGPPTSGGVISDEAFFYVSSQFRTVGAFEPEEIDRQVVAISFSPGGVVRNVERFTKRDGQIVALDRRVTEDGINDVTVLSQLLASFGRIDAGQLLGGGGDNDL